MPKHLYFLCLILGVISLPPATAQDYAAVQLRSPSTKVVAEPNLISLKSLLEQLESKFDVRFNYKANAVKSVKVTARPLTHFKDGMSKQLNYLLAPMDLRCIEIDPVTFVIKETRATRNQSAVKVESMLAQEVSVPIAGSLADEPMRGELRAANERSITGRVTDATTGEGLPGVNIMIKGTQKGTATDVEGAFTLAIPNDDAILVFSFVGFVSQEVIVGNRTNLEIQLGVDEKSLDEVVVIGYGTAKKSDLTGSVTRVNADIYKTQSMNQVTDMLAGTVAGFNSNQGTSAAGGGSLEVRGPTSLSAGTTPLIVVDGAIFHGSLRDINPNDIQSVDILKDASSAAIFGSKSASGVIIITTMKGKSETPTISFSAKLGVSNPTRARKPFGPDQYIGFRQDYLRTVNPRQDYDFYSHPDRLPSTMSLENWRNLSPNPASDNLSEWMARLEMFPIEQENYRANKTTDWYKEIIKSGLRQEYDLSIGGEKDNLNYYWSIGYNDNNGVVIGDKYKSVRSRLNINFKVNDWLDVGANTQFSNRDEGAVLGSMNFYANSPFGRIFDPNGNLERLPHGHTENPLLNYYRTDRMKKVNSLFSNMFADVKLPFGIKYRFSYQPRFEFMKDYQFVSKSPKVGGLSTDLNNGFREEYSDFAWMIDNIISWKKDVGQHGFDVTLLANIEENKRWASVQRNVNFFPNEELSYHGLQFGSGPSILNNDFRNTADALMARLNYSYGGKYLLTASISAADVTIEYIFDERAKELYIEEPRHSEMVRVSYIMAELGLGGYSKATFSSKNWYYDRVMRVNHFYHPPIFFNFGFQATLEPHNVL
jgi:TonB-linked SusC/RagA family outer membrane protein